MYLKLEVHYNFYGLSVGDEADASGIILRYTDPQPVESGAYVCLCVCVCMILCQ